MGWVQMAKERKATVRSATRMLILVATSYLVSNLLHVIIVAWENIHAQSLRLASHPPSSPPPAQAPCPPLRTENRFFYSISSDVISLSKIVSSSMRLPIYMWCNRKVRHEVPSPPISPLVC